MWFVSNNNIHWWDALRLYVCKDVLCISLQMLVISIPLMLVLSDSNSVDTMIVSIHQSTKRMAIRDENVTWVSYGTRVVTTCDKMYLSSSSVVSVVIVKVL